MWMPCKRLIEDEFFSCCLKVAVTLESYVQRWDFRGKINETSFCQIPWRIVDGEECADTSCTIQTIDVKMLR